jgi:subtilisin family serine protease
MVFGAAPTGQQPIRFPAEKVEPGLRQDILASPSGQGTFLVYPKEQADLSKAYSISDWVERGQYVYETLWNTARQSQAGLVSYLVNQVQLNAASGYRSHYIVNAMLVTANVDTLDVLAARPDIAYIEAVKKYSVPKPIPGVANGETETAIEWGVAKIRADQVWTDFGVRGEGIVVANIDTGVLNSHPALVNQYRGTTTGSHDYNWFDPTGIYPTAPGDDNGHGTHTMGTMIGSEGGIYQVGVAPAARWIAAKAFERDGWGSSSDLLAAAEWVLAPYPIAGSPADADPSRRPHVVNSSWGGHGGDPWFQASVAAWRAAGIFPVFAAGNSGPNPGTIDSPADYAESFASGATDSSDTIASSSGRGPSSLTSEIKPDLSTPGVDVNSAWNDGGYATFSGTSMASPHAAGCAALILSAAPSLSLEAIENVMTSTAIDLGTRGPDYDYGYGRVDCYAAVAKAVVLWLSVTPTSGTVPPSGNQDITVVFDADGLAIGTYTASIVISNNDPNENPVTVPVTMTVTRPATWGKLEGAVTGLGYCDANPAPLANADVLIEDSTGMTWTLTTDISGTYQIWLDEAHSPLTLTVTYPDYETGQATGITITGQGTTTQEFDLRWLQPCLSVNPTDVNVTLALSGTATQTLTILNIGALMSDFALFERNGGFVIAQHQTEDQLHIGGQVHTVNESKEASPDTIGQGPLPLASGGPDPFGYTYKDSHEVDGPIYQWIEIAPPAGGTGTKLHGLTGEDDAYFWPLSLPFTFTFYETDYMELAVASNGTLYFEDQHLGYRNVPIPGSNRYGVDRFIAHLWDDLVINPGAVYYQAFDSMFIIEYYQASGYGSPGYASWEVILFENGNILFQYQDVTFGNFRDYGGDATVGIQGDPTTGLQYSYNTAPLSDGLAICFAHPGQSPDCSLDVPWLSVNPTTGTVLPSGTQAIDAIFDASVPEVAQLGEYYATLVIQSNDPGTPQFQVPVTMTVAVPSYNVFLPLISK